MPDSRKALLPLAALASGLGLTAVAGFGGTAAALGATLAQPAFALAAARWQRKGDAVADGWRADAWSLLLAWLATAGLFAALLAWPFASLLARGTLGAALATSLALGLALLAAWHAWPWWHGLAREGGKATQHWHAISKFEPGAWRGLGVAVAVVVLASLPLLLAWPGLLDARARWNVVLAALVLAPLLHWLLQRVAPPARRLEPWLAAMEADGDADDDRVALADGEDPEAALYAAARGGRVDRALALLEAGADPHALPPAEDRDQRSLPVLAAVLPDLRLLRALIARGLDLNAAHAGMTPLLAATRDSWHGRPEAVMTLLANGADPRVRDRDGNTPLHHAARSSDPGVAALLRDAAAELEVTNEEGLSPLGVACTAGNWRLARFLLERGASPQPEGATPALLAAAGIDEDDPAGVQLLLKHKAKVDARDARGRSALHEAAGAGHPELVEVLLAAGADRGAIDEEGLRPVDIAARERRWTVVAALDPDYPIPAVPEPEDEADPDAETDAVAGDATAPEPEVEPTGLLALLAQGPEALDALAKWLDRGVAPTGVGGLGCFLDACAAADGVDRSLESFAIGLLERGADPFGPGAAGDPPLALAVRLDWTRLAARLLANGADRAARDSRGMTAMHLAAALGREQALKVLVLHGASPGLRAADGQTPLGVALASGRRELVEWLDWRGWQLPGRALEPADLPAAAIVGDADAVRRLLDLGFGIDTVDAQGCSALLRAAGGGHREVVELLLERGADPQLGAHTGATPLSAAVSMRHVDIVDRLLAAGAGLEQRLPGEVTVLMLAAALGLPDLCARLLQAGANVHAGDAQGLTPLHCAVLFGFTAREKPRLLALLDTLLLAGAEPDAVAAGGVTPLLLLLGARAEPGTACDEDVVLIALERLLDEEVALDVQDPRGFGPLHLAALHGLLKVTRRLLRAGCDPGLRDTLNRSPREIAVMRGFVDVAAEYAPVNAGASMARFLRDSDR
ncbi:MAG: hypothetical protein EPO30_04275 [Lysobacteraceae bacterium]|nr:MAG: hypothetical protein EPO30_04275 [Xanthomonadaceae bacterium]